MRLILSHQTRSSLAKIYDYIVLESGNKKTASDFVQKLRRKCEQLASHSFHMGSLRPDLGEDIRSYPYGNYLILFRYTAEAMEVAMIVEGHRDIESLF